MKVFALLAALALAAAPAAAQLVPGDIGVTGFSTSQFSVIDSSGVTPYLVTSFGGTGTTQSILWDPANPSDLIVGGFGFVGRAAITGPGTSTYTLITNAIGTASQMSWDAAGQIIVADAGTDQVRSVDPLTGIITELTMGTQPWGNTVNGGAVDPVTGDIYVGNNGNVYRVDSLGTVTHFATGWTTGTSYVSGIAFDPTNGDVIVTALTVNRVLRIPAGGSPTPPFTGPYADVVPPGAISGLNSISVDSVNGDFVIGGSSGSVYRVPFGGGAPTVIGTASGQGSSASGVSVVGTSGPPSFTLAANAYLDGSADFAISNIPVGTTSGWTFASADTSAPVGMGWAFGINPDALTFLILNIAPFPQPGNLFHWLEGFPTLYPAATFNFPAGTLTPLSGSSFDFLALGQDAGLFIIGSTNVVRVVIP
jgi:hypothetical protein